MYLSDRAAHLTRMRRRWQLLAALGASLLAGTAATCQPLPPSDSATPIVYLLAFQNAGGQQGAQVRVDPGGSFTTAHDFLGTNQADIRVYGSETPGITTLTVTGRGTAHCSTGIIDGQVFTAPGTLPVTLSAQTERAPAGQVQDFLAVELGEVLLGGKVSCGSHIYNGMPRREEFFLDTATWQLHAQADNCCGGKATGDFTVAVN